MDVTLVQVPYDSGHYGARMGRGPLHLLERGLDRDLAAAGHAVARMAASLPHGFHHEIGAAAALYRQVREAVAEARGAGRFPVVLAGNCNAAALGTVAALSAEAAPGSTAVVWLDAHADFNTPETSPSGFFDGMALSVLTGHSWSAWAASLPGFATVPEDRVLLVGARDLDAAERDLLDASEVARLPAEAFRAGGKDGAAALAPHLDRLAGRAERAYLHLDLDVLDPEEGPANAYAAAGGLRLAEALELIEAVAGRLPLAAAALTSFDPAADPSGRAATAAKRLVLAMVAAADRS
ncbi:MAG TPA: arginase family protein [Thermoanaerobaculia bacterium]